MMSATFPLILTLILIGEEKKSPHRWQDWDEKCLVESVNELAPVHDGYTNAFYTAVANRINEKFRGGPKFVLLDAQKVRYKLESSMRKLAQVFAPLLLVLCPATTS